MSPQPDLVILFCITEPGIATPSAPKAKLKEQTNKALTQYNALISTLRQAGFHAVARRGHELGHLAIFIRPSTLLLQRLIYAERQADFLAHIPLSSPLPPDPDQLSPADRIRLIFTYLSASKQDGGLAITPELPEWDLIESITPLHDNTWNDTWIRQWTTHRVGPSQLTSIRHQFGSKVATYFSFLSLYTQSLHFPALLGAVFFYISNRSSYWTYHPVYSILLVVWGTVWVQWWSAHEKALAIETGHESVSVPDVSAVDLPVTPLNTTHPRRPSYREGDQWYRREYNIFVLGIPVVSSFIVLLGSLLTCIFLLEAFVSHLYTGPGAKVFPLLPTVLFSLLIPNFVKFSTKFLHGMTERENHRTRNGWESSLALKVWALNATVAYLGLFLSAFVYVPFGDGILGFLGSNMSSSTETTGQVSAEGLKAKLNPSRLQKQMFAYTVTNQGVNTFLEVGLPWVLKGLNVLRERGFSKKGKKGAAPGSPITKKRVLFEDEQSTGGQAEREWLDEVREELTRPPYDLGADYSEMVMQYGYVIVFSVVWPLAGAMALINNIIELRSDAYKIGTHVRRPLMVSRVESIGPWLKPLEILTWVGACVNAALVYLFWDGSDQGGSPLTAEAQTTPDFDSRIELLKQALMVSLVASHVYLVFRYVVRRVVERAVLSGVASGVHRQHHEVGEWKPLTRGEEEKAPEEFWEYDEGVAEIERIRKEA